MNADLQAKLDAAAKRAKSRGRKAEAIIWTNVLFNAIMGVVPFEVDRWAFVGANVARIIALGYLYGFTTNREQVGALIRQIFSGASITLVALYIGINFFFRRLEWRGRL